MRRDELTLPDPPPNDRPGDRWVCAGHTACARGPNANGTCPLAEACQPMRTWHGKRRSVTVFALVILTVCIFAMSRGEIAATVFKPGELTTPHAQILSGTMDSQRCSSCHPQAATSPASWFSAEQAGHADVRQSDRCLDCHHTIIDRSNALLAHNLTKSARAELVLTSLGKSESSWHDAAPGPAVDQENIECNACHREHRGADADLLAISDAQCQTCHADRFGSFASSHPDWDRWPYGRGRQVAFNHATHANKHFPGTAPGSSGTQFQCADCHRRRDDNELTRTTTYERGCKSCHDPSLRLEASEGIELLVLPTLPDDAANQIQPWPKNAVGFYEGKIAPIASLLLRSDDSIAVALRELPNHDFSGIDGNQAAIAAGQTIAKAHRTLLQTVADKGQQAIVDRAAANGVAPATLTLFVQSLSPQLLRSAHQNWFDPASQQGLTKLSSNVHVRPAQHRLAAKPDDDLLGGDTLSDPLNDPLSDPLNDPLINNAPAKSTSPQRFDPDTMLPEGGWYRDDLRMAIRYRGGGHADPVLKSTIELISQLPAGDLVREGLLKTRAVTACVSCHPGAVSTTGGWHSDPLIGRRSEFTKFTHGSHLNVAQLADCTHCHRIHEGIANPIALTSSNVQHSAESADFDHLSRAACASCHIPQAAGDSCVTCHRYHIDLR
jgi:Doubled CXXCH motif (Paired_CXXCH_1)